MPRSGFLFIVAAVLAGCSSSGGDNIVESSLSGKVAGQPWTFQVGATDAFLSDDTSFFAALYATPYTACVDSEPTTPHLLVSVPKKPGDYDLSLALNITFAVGSSDNLISLNGKITVDSVTATSVTGGLVTRYDDGNDVNGQFELTICPDQFAAPSAGR
jgi:hypothetical protein